MAVVIQLNDVQGAYKKKITKLCIFSAVFAVMVQSVLSTLIDAFAIGWIIAKISRPKKRAEVWYFTTSALGMF